MLWGWFFGRSPAGFLQEASMLGPENILNFTQPFIDEPTNSDTGYLLLNTDASIDASPGYLGIY